jgi:acyl-CoA dehydrogenase
MTTISIVLFILALMTLAYIRTSLLVFSVVSAFLLADLLLVLKTPWPLFIPLWTAYVAILVFFNLTAIRRHFLTLAIFAIFRKVMPSISSTEQAAIDAGDTWWEKELLNGKPHFRNLRNIPKPTLSPEEQKFMDEQVNTLCGMIDDWEITHELTDLPEAMWEFLKNEGFFGLIIPKEYGGRDFSEFAHSEIIARISSKSISVAVTVSVPNSLGPAELLIKYGTDAQKNKFLPKLANGKEIPCFALTNPNAGSDASAIPDYGIICKQEFAGEERLGMRLNWDKRYITLAPVATLLGLAFKLYDPDHLLGEKDYIGITTALIPTDTPGVVTGRRHYPMNVAFQNGPTQGKDVFIPIEWIIGGQDNAGKGWRMLMECLSAGRAISLPSISAGPAAALATATGAYARIREQFNLPIGYFEGIEEALARMGGYAYICEATRQMTAAALDLGIKPSIAGAISKYHVTELSRKGSLDAMDIHAGKGICLGRKNYIARFYQAMPIGITVEGANILTRSLIIFGQGALRCHPYLLKEIYAAQNKDKAQGLKDFDLAFWGHAGYIISNFCRTVFLSFSNGLITFEKAPRATRQYYRQIRRLSAALALTTDFAMAILGGDLKRKEKLSARLGDVLSNLYLTTAVLKRFHDEGEHVADLPLLHWAARYTLSQAEFNLHRFYKNFPNRWLARIMHFFVLPYGRMIETPDDKMGHKIARLLMEPNEARARLGQIGFYDDDGKNNFGLLETGLKRCIAAEPVSKKIKQAIKDGKLAQHDYRELIERALEAGVITPDEASIAEQAREYRDMIIAVNDFPGYSTIHGVKSQFH